MFEYNGITYTNEGVLSLIEDLGGLKAIQDKINSGNLMFGEKYYLEHILMVLKGTSMGATMVKPTQLDSYEYNTFTGDDVWKSS